MDLCMVGLKINPSVLTGFFFSSIYEARGGVHPGQVTSTSQGNKHPNIHVFGVWRKMEYLEGTQTCTGRA